ncbi:queuine tRNA-ribosyltransferase family protein [Candidatus Pacearchaeota archaeon]|nr:queuine tRNA-ribosyltransferase family protein [Candidatus Pacearchaeota archaeon]
MNKLKDLQFLEVKNKKMQLPAFLPDATLGFVRGVSSNDLLKCGIEGVVVNIYHLLHGELINKIKEKKGIGNYMKFPGIIISDSGGFQVMSLIHDNPQNGKINDDGATFLYNNKKTHLTPEKSVELQLSIGSDVVMCLDDCTYPDSSLEEQNISVKRTVEWAGRCKKEFLKLTKDMKANEKPLLFGIIQGGNNLDLRKKCADALKEIEFDGYAFGGWPVSQEGNFLNDILKYVAELMPENKPRYAMGVGRPEDIVACVGFGYDMFDCVIPTREARNNRLYSFKSNFFGFGLRKLKNNKKFYEYIRIRNLKYKTDKKPISKNCDCFACSNRNFTREQIYKMFKERDKEAIRLATIHNLRFYTKLMERLRNQ